jgi:hypothetical protein
MPEKAVFWLGGKPGQAGAPKKGIEQEQEFAAAIRQTCETNGFQVREYVAAQGAFGSWLMQLSKDGGRQRLVWNGKDGQLLFEQVLETGGWEQLCAGEVAVHDLNGFITVVQSMLATGVGQKT